MDATVSASTPRQLAAPWALRPDADRHAADNAAVLPADAAQRPRARAGHQHRGVQRERGVHLGVREQSVGEHIRRAEPDLLAGLEHQLHRAAQLGLVRFQQLCRAEQHSGVAVVTAGVAIAVFRGEGQTALLPHGQRVHVRAQQDAGRARADHGGDAAFAAAPGLDAALAQALHDKRRRPRRLQPDLGEAVNRAAVFRDLRSECICLVQKAVFHNLLLFLSDKSENTGADESIRPG